MAAEIYLLRHGETEWNVAGRLQGKLDSPLTPRGFDQARHLGAILARRLGGRESIALRIEVSPLGRARQTAAIVAQQVRCSGDIVIEPRLREITMGSWDGLTRAEVAARYADRLRGVNRYEWYFRALDGESYETARDRVRSWLDEQSRPVIAVSHGITGRLIRGAYLKLPRDETLSLPTAHDVVWLLAGGRVEGLR